MPLPNGKTVVGSKWVFKVKCGPDGSIDRFKARFIAQGFSQKYGLDYADVFAPVARANYLRIILAIANATDMEIHHMDVKTVFLNGNLIEEVHMKQPEGYINPMRPDYVCRLHKSLFGLKQSVKCWNNVIDQYFKDKRYVQNQANWCVYVKNVIKRGNKSTMIVFLHVDDILLACNDQRLHYQLQYCSALQYRCFVLAFSVLGSLATSQEELLFS